jgi:hypothetical protein
LCEYLCRAMRGFRRVRILHRATTSSVISIFFAVNRTATNTEWLPEVVLIQFTSWGWAHSCSKHVEDLNKHIIEKIVRQVGYLPQIIRRCTVKKYKMYLSLCLSVRLSAWNNSAPTGGIFMKFDICVPFENLSKKVQFV